MGRPNAYHLLSIGEKQTRAVEQQREPPVQCPVGCGVQVPIEDLQGHLAERCAGQRDPGPAARWVDFRQATAIVPKRTLVRWTQNGKARFQGNRGDRKYLLADLVQRSVRIRLDRRR